MSTDANKQLVFKNILYPFFIKRAFRLLPGSWLWMGLVLLASVIYNQTNAFGQPLQNFIYSLSILSFTYNIFAGYFLEAGFLPTYGPYWSLSLEEQFCFVAPFILLLFNAQLRTVILIVLAIILFFTINQNGWTPNFRYEGLVLGLLLAIAKNKFRNRLKPSFMQNRLLRLIFFNLLIFSLLITPAFFDKKWFMLGTLALISVALVYFSCWPEEYLLRIRKDSPLSKVMIWIAARSYSLYLIHMPVIYFVQETTVRIFIKYGFKPKNDLLVSFVMSFAALTLIMLLADINYRFVENPLRNKGRAIALRQKTKKGL